MMHITEIDAVDNT